MLHTEARGGTPYGATTIAGGQGELQPAGFCPPWALTSALRLWGLQHRAPTFKSRAQQTANNGDRRRCDCGRSSIRN